MASDNIKFQIINIQYFHDCEKAAKEAREVEKIGEDYIADEDEEDVLMISRWVLNSNSQKKAWPS